MFKTYTLFKPGDIKDLISQIIYYYLFQGMSLTSIEEKIFGTQNYKGWLSKSFLNYYGIDTEKENKGIYKGRTITEVIEELYQSDDIYHIRVASLLKEKFG